MLKNASSLKLINITSILFHENHESKRLSFTKQCILDDGFLKEPVLVMDIDEDKYLLLDGLHRTLTLRELGCYWIPAQIVSESDVELKSWNHLLPRDKWLDSIKNSYDFIFTKNSKDRIILGKITYSNGTTDEICVEQKYDNDIQLISLWNKLVNSYNSDYLVKRIHNDEHIKVDNNEVLMQYHVVNMSLIKKIVLKGLTLPSGVTRFVIKERILNFQVPFKLLKHENHEHIAEVFHL
ncbi:ParB N-terminal domain-containing protein [Chengkuizengella marina]|uniref:ParB/Sulfiredoxin domain-containing protein n=1 Tax=Chengkuizengella marina TaxID=2507566 RepID=A0A6N9Q8I2_9BACL|nr:ParB N-terminal domain-containing protein [Chengkuizengella marina]NBI31162.1 hypothetical protein [Chengkuizengella marina]